MTPDLDIDPDDPGPVPFADLRDPQTLNLYPYVRNNPLNGIDPDGHKSVCTSTSSTDEYGNVKLRVTCHDEADDPPSSQPTVADQLRTLFQSDISDPADKQAVGFGLIRDVVSGNANWGNLNDYLPQTPTFSTNPPPPNIPIKVLKTLEAILNTGKPPHPNQRGGQRYKNTNGALPTIDGHGNPITYKEWDVEPSKFEGNPRSAERLVTGHDSSGNVISAYYTDQHYTPGSFKQIK